MLMFFFIYYQNMPILIVNKPYFDILIVNKIIICFYSYPISLYFIYTKPICCVCFMFYIYYNIYIYYLLLFIINYLLFIVNYY